MVVFFEWHSATMDQTSRSGLSLSGEETDLEALSSPLVGYLGKVQKRAASLENCPWCTSKGLTFALRSYRINLQESITLCTNPQCLFPLVSRSLEDVLDSLVPVEHPVGCKRKNTLTPGKEDLIEPAHKHQRSVEHDGAQNITSTLLEQATQDGTVASDNQPGLPRVDGEKVNGYHQDPLDVEKVGSDGSGFENIVSDTGPEKAPCTDAFNLFSSSYLTEQLQPPSKGVQDIDGVMPVLSSHCGALRVSGAEDNCGITPEEGAVVSNQSSCKNENMSSHHNAQAGRTPLSTCKHADNSQSDTEDKASVEVMKTSELFTLPSQLFWRNSENLCWLDSMLVALVNCKSLKRCRPEAEPQRSSVWRLIREYEDICHAVQGHQHSSSDGAVKVSKDVLQKTNADLHSLRMSVFQRLQPKLHCELGKEETPVFALPLLLAMDTWVEPLFQSVFRWELKCSECGAATEERVRKTLPTFTDIVPDWHPLRAAHLAPCNTCRRKHQRRTMILESVPQVFGLHFVQGLPDNDVKNYRFTFSRNCYSITTVIQYKQHLKHFVTWIRLSDGSWLEYDDLKHPECRAHGTLTVPAEEMHVVFWEAEEASEPAACSPSISFSDSPLPEARVDSSGGDGAPDRSPDQSLEIPHNDTAIVSALSAPGDASAVDTSIGSTTLLDAFEGLSHDDIITFTLVEVTPDLINGGGQMLGSSAAVTNGTPDSTADSSSAPPPAASTHSPPEPTCVAGEAMREIVRHDGTQRAKKADLSKTDQDVSPPASSELLNTNGGKPTPERDSTASPETTQQASPVSSSGNPSSGPAQEAPQNVPPSHSRWSYLLSRNPLFPNKKPVEKLSPATALAHSTPNPGKRPLGPGGQAPKPQLKKEDGSLPIKAAAMYNSFGIKHPSLGLGGSPNLPCPVSPNHHPQNTMEVCGTSPPLLETSCVEMSSRRVGRHSSKIPPGLSETEALRYKLIKRLKAKKKKLAKLNEMLGCLGADSTNINSPGTVTSSTYNGSVGDGLLLDLLSPATTASNLSPDSTSFLEMIATGQEGATQLDNGAGATPQANAYKTESSSENFLEEFISQVASQRATEMETEALSALDLFV